MEEFLKTYWGAIVAVISFFLFAKEKWFKVKKDVIDTEITAFQRLQNEVKAMGELIDRKEKEHRDEMKERDREWTEKLEKKDKEHREDSQKNTKLISDLTTKVEVYKTENNQKDEKIKEQQAVIENRNPRLEEFLEQNLQAQKQSIEVQKQTLDFMKKYVTPISAIH